MTSINSISPYIRRAMMSTIIPEAKINSRTIYDYCLIYIEKGDLKITINNKEYICRDNDVVLLRPNIEHSEECCENTAVIQPHIHFDMVYDENSTKIPISFRSITRFSPSEKELIREDIFLGTDIDCPIIKINDKELFHEILLEIVTLYKNKPNHYQLLAREKLIHLIYMIFNSNKLFLDTTEEKNSFLHQIKEYIDNNANNIITLDMLSLQFHYSKYYIEKLFREAYGCSLIKYYNNVRVNKAKMMLLEVKSVSEVALQMDFGSPALFSRFFKNNVGQSPTEYIQGNS